MIGHVVQQYRRHVRAYQVGCRQRNGYDPNGDGCHECERIRLRPHNVRKNRFVKNFDRQRMLRTLGTIVAQPHSGIADSSQPKNLHEFANKLPAICAVALRWRSNAPRKVRPM